MTTAAIQPRPGTDRKGNYPKRVGAIRPSQILHTYGVGALVDLPNFSVIVAGLQSWRDPIAFIEQDRLLDAVQIELGPQVQNLAAMPWMEETDNPMDEWARIGVPVISFPRWLRCTKCNVLSTIQGGLFSLESNAYRIDKTRYIHKNCNPNGKSPLAVPARFVMACRNGHLDEFPWQEFAHDYKACPKGGQGTLSLIEAGSGTRSTEIFVRCNACEQSRMIATAFNRNVEEGPQCRGRHPHLRRFESCDHVAEPLLLGASNTWFGITRSALALPIASTSTPLDDAVEAAWNHLANPDINDVTSLGFALKFNANIAHLASFDQAELWDAVERRRNPKDPQESQQSDLKAPEWERFIDPAGAPDTIDFTIEDAGVPKKYQQDIAQVVAATRLRETSALIGFARVEPPDSGFGEDESHVRRVALSTENPTWVPANDTRGEGIFVRLPEQRIAAWEQQAENDDRIKKIRSRVVARNGEAGWPGTRYVVLHSLAHLLINELSLECGYNAASLRERIYCNDGAKGDEPMAGILIYTAAADSEGTLGGLVQMAKQETVGRVLDAAIRRADLCTSDPLCAEHKPSVEDGTQHAAACHSCLFVPETSCESNNRLLDRATLVPTMADSGMAYFARE